MGSRSALLALCLAGATAGCAHGNGAESQSAPQTARVGSPAPVWSEPSVPGPTLSSSALRGKALYLNFFATWCPPCNEEAPAIDSLARRYADRGLQVVGVDVLENARKAASFRLQHHLAYPVVVDGGTLRDAYNVNGLPVHVFIDRNGIVRKIVVGELSAQRMQDEIERVLQ